MAQALIFLAFLCPMVAFGSVGKDVVVILRTEVVMVRLYTFAKYVLGHLGQMLPKVSPPFILVPPRPDEQAPFGLEEGMLEKPKAENRANFVTRFAYWPKGRVPYEFAPDVPGMYLLIFFRQIFQM